MENKNNFIFNFEKTKGNLITLALEGKFDVIAHGVNCFCIQKAGIAKDMDIWFGTGSFSMESTKERNKQTDEGKYMKVSEKGNFNKLGNIDIGNCHIAPKVRTHTKNNKSPYCYTAPYKVNTRLLSDGWKMFFIVNCYIQYRYGRDKDYVDYEALTLCMRKLNHRFPGKHIGLPMIGSGLAGGNWDRIQQIIKKELSHMKVTIVEYDGSQVKYKI